MSSQSEAYQSDLADFDYKQKQKHDDEIIERTPTDAATRVDTERDSPYYKLERVATPQREDQQDGSTSDHGGKNNTVDDYEDDTAVLADDTIADRSRKHTKERRRSSLAEKLGYMLHPHHHKDKNGGRNIEK